MTDIYTLGIKADTRDIDRGKTSLDKFGKSADSAGKSTEQFNQKSKDAQKATAAFGRSSGQAGIQLQQFVGQIQGGQSAMLALSQQSADLGFVLGAPLLGAVAGLSASVVGLLVPSLFSANDAIEKLDEISADLETTLQRTGGGVAQLSEHISNLASQNEALAQLQIASSIQDAEKQIKLASEGIIDALEDAESTFNGVMKNSEAAEAIRRFGGDLDEVAEKVADTVGTGKLQALNLKLDEIGRQFGITRKEAAGFLLAMDELKNNTSAISVKAFQEQLTQLNLAAGGSNEKITSLSKGVLPLLNKFTEGVDVVSMLRMAFFDLDGELKKSKERSEQYTALTENITNSLKGQVIALEDGKEASILFGIAQKLGLEDTKLIPKAIREQVEALTSLTQKQIEATAAKKAAAQEETDAKAEAELIGNITASLQQQILTLQDNAKASMELGIARKLGLKDGEEIPAIIQAEIDALSRLTAEKKKLKAQEDEANKAAKNATALTSMIASLDNQRKALSLTGDELRQYTNELELAAEKQKALKLGASPEELAQIETQVRAIQELRKAMTERESIDDVIDGAERLGDVFSNTGNVILDTFGSAINIMDDFADKMEVMTARQKELNEARALEGATAEQRGKIDKELMSINQEMGKQKLHTIGLIASQTEKMFKEGSKAQKAAHAISTGIAVAEMAMALQKITVGTAETAAHVANEGVKASANATTAVTSAFAAPFPTNFIAGAAMIGIMASIVGGFSGGGGTFTDPTEGRQDEQGTGSVLGSSDKSASISKAQDRFEDIQIDQLSELRGIRSSLNNIGSGIALVTKGLITGANFDGEGVTGLGESISGGTSTLLSSKWEILNDKLTSGLSSDLMAATFGKIKSKVIDSGIQFFAQSFKEIFESGELTAAVYNEIEITKSKLFGAIKSESIETQYDDIGNSLAGQMAKIFSSIGDAVISSAKALGLDTVTVIKQTVEGIDLDDINIDFEGGIKNTVGAGIRTVFEEVNLSLEDALDTFTIDLGKISLEGLSGEEIQAELEAVFSQQADLIAEYLVPSIAEYQQVGEGAFDTLLRVTQEQAVFNDALSVMGMSLADLSNVMQIDIAQGIIEMVGGAERFGTLTQSFFNDFFSEAEQFDVLAGSIADVFGQLGVSVSDSRDAFRELVESQDLTTEAGRQLFSTLLEIAPAIDEYFDTLEERAEDELALAERTASEIARAEEKAAQDAIRLAERTEAEKLRAQEKAAHEAARIENERANLTIRLLELQGKSEEALTMSREMQLAATNEALRPLLELIFAEEDLRAARVESGEVLEELIDVEQINRERTELTIRLLELQGKAEEALTLIRERELANTNESLRPLLELIFAEEDLAREREEATRATEEAARATEDLAASLRRAATENINGAGAMLSKSVALEKQRLRAILDTGKEAHKAESERLKEEVSAINEAKNARLKALSSERGAVEKNMQYLLGIANKFNQSGSTSVGVDDALNAAKRGDFSLADQLKVQQLDAGSFGSASDYNVAQALQDNKLQIISGLAANAANRAGGQLSRIDRQISQDEAFYDSQLTKLDTLIASNEETLEEYQASYDEQIENLQKIEAAAEDQLNALLGIDGSVLSVYEAIKQLAEMPGISGSTDNTAAQLLELSKEAKAAQASIAKTSAATAAILQRLELGGLDTRVLS